MQRIIIVGAGFAGLRAARDLGGVDDAEVTVIDARNHHLFQPLLYQVAMAGLSPAEIAVPIRSTLAGHGNVRVLNERVVEVDLEADEVVTASSRHAYDYLVLACGAATAYFGHDEWEEFAPGLKSISQATGIRHRVLRAFEEAETERDPDVRRALLTFVVIGGGPTGVELAGAIGEMSRFTLARDFREIDPGSARIILLEAGPRILPTFSEGLARRATADLESLGVEVWTDGLVTAIDATGVEVGDQRIETRTALWAAGVAGSPINAGLSDDLDRQGRIPVCENLALPGHPNVFIAGDQAHVDTATGGALPGIAPVAMQQGAYLARQLAALVAGDRFDEPFVYNDKGQLATIGRKRAVLQIGRFELAGFFAWVLWWLVHIYYLVGFKNRLFVVLQWAWAYVSFRRGARLIVDEDDPVAGPGG